jgi:preprotein translocase subunit SecG
MSITFILLTLLFVAVSVAMILIILVQRPQGGGLAGAFGGAGGGGTDTAFGGRTGDALTLATVGAFTAYLLLGVVINVIGNPRAFADGSDPAEAESALVSPDLVTGGEGAGAGATTTGRRDGGTGDGGTGDGSDAPATDRLDGDRPDRDATDSRDDSAATERLIDPAMTTSPTRPDQP